MYVFVCIDLSNANISIYKYIFIMSIIVYILIIHTYIVCMCICMYTYRQYVCVSILFDYKKLQFYGKNIQTCYVTFTLSNKIRQYLSSLFMSLFFLPSSRYPLIPRTILRLESRSLIMENPAVLPCMMKSTANPLVTLLLTV